MTRNGRVAIVRLTLAFLLVASVSVLNGCTSAGTGGSSPGKPGPSDEEKTEKKPPAYTSWVVDIKDTDSFSQGGITYSIELDLSATNPSQEKAGTYTGSATALTSTTGNVNGLPLNASATAKSSSLSFKLVEGFESEGGALAPLTEENQVHSGTGSIVMKAAGGGTIGPAGGSFSNTSGQPVTVQVQGSKVTLSVVISGHKYTFQGTLTGKE